MPHTTAHWIRPGFLLLEDFFSTSQAACWLDMLLEMGSDAQRGFTHPDLKPNRFHAHPKYPVKRYCCMGLYWSPLDYGYHEHIPGTDITPFPIPPLFLDCCRQVVSQYFGLEDYHPQTALVNYYVDGSRMGLHVDKEEKDQISPVVGASFGSACRFYYEDEHGEIRDIRLPGNSLYIFGGEARLMRHGIGTVYARSLPPGEERLTEKERLSVTFRRVYP